jgi:hypothetical protein
LFGFEIQVAELVDQQDVQTRQAIQQPARALLSRVRHYCHTVPIDGPSLREPQS